MLTKSKGRERSSDLLGVFIDLLIVVIGAVGLGVIPRLESTACAAPIASDSMWFMIMLLSVAGLRCALPLGVQWLKNRSFRLIELSCGGIRVKLQGDISDSTEAVKTLESMTCLKHDAPELTKATKRLRKHR
jgi:hypothetical protein